MTTTDPRADPALTAEPTLLDLAAEDLAVEALADGALLGTAGSFACGASFSCPASSASTAGSFSSAG